MARTIKTIEGAFRAVKKDGMALKNVQSELMTAELCLEAVKQNGQALGYVPPMLKTAELCHEAIKQNGNSYSILGYLPAELRTTELCMESVKRDGGFLSAVPEKLRTAELCLEAVKAAEQTNAWTTLSFVPEELRTAEMCLEAVKQKGNMLEIVPEKLKTEELCIAAVKESGYALHFVPKELYETIRAFHDYYNRVEVWDSSTPPKNLGIFAADSSINNVTHSFLSPNNYLLCFNVADGLPTNTAIRFPEANQGGYPMFAIREPNRILHNPNNGGAFYEYCDKTFSSSVDGYQSSYAVDGTAQNSPGGVGTAYYQMKTIAREELGIPDVIKPPLVLKSASGRK